MAPGVTPPVAGNESGTDVLVIGRYFCDLIITGLGAMPHLGEEIWATGCELVPGAAFIPAVALRRLGLRAAWPCYFGTDLLSEFVRQRARQEGLDERWFIESGQPAFCLSVALSIGSERAFVSYMDEIPEPAYPELIGQLRPSWVILPHLTTGAKLEAITHAARQSQTRVLMDCQSHHTSLDEPAVRSALEQVDVFSPNLSEALQLTQTRHVEAALAALADLCPFVVIKLGSDGAIAQRGKHIARAPGIPASVVDTTGAGDNFNCGFIYAQLRGYSIEDSLLCGNICGGLSTQTRGGTAAAPTAAAVEAWRSRVEAER
jgi:sugar/nucleoside kinase (ribokinase family)